MKKVLLDCDGVIYDLLGHTLEALKLLSPVQESYETKINRIKNYSFIKDLDPRDQALVYPIWSLPGFAYSIPLTFLGFKLERLSSHNCKFEFVTKPYHSDTWIADRRLSIIDHFGEDVPVHFAEDKSEFDGDIFIEDKLSNLLDWMEKHPNGFGILAATPYTASQFAEENVDINNLFYFEVFNTVPFSVFLPNRNFCITNKNFALLCNIDVYDFLNKLIK